MDNKMTCCFFGHREVTHNIRPKLTAIIEKLITENGVTEFYVGHQGQFDSIGSNSHESIIHPNQYHKQAEKSIL